MSGREAIIRVCMVSWKYFPLTEGGSEKQCRRIVAELSLQGIQCTVLTALLDRRCIQRENRGSEGSIIRLGAFAWIERFFHRWFDAFRNIPWLRQFELESLRFWLSIPFSYIARISFMLSLRRYLHNNRETIDILHVHEGHWIAGAVAWASKGLQIPVVCKEATYPFVSRLGYDTPLRKTLTNLRKNLRFIALTDSVRESLLKEGVKAENINLIPNGVEVPHRQAGVLFSESVVYIGNFTQGARQKAFDILFQAWIRVHAERPSLTLIVLGGGDYSSWLRFLENNQCEKSVKFMGTVPDVGIYLEKARLFVLPSRTEGLSNALLEAMSWGVPVAISDIPPHTGLIRHKKNGLLFPVNDSEALAQAILELAANDELALALADGGKKTIIENFSIEKIAVLLIQLYADLLSCRRNT